MMRNDKGFTLLEVMIAIAIFGFLMGMVSQLMRSEIRTYSNVDKQYEIEQKARTAMMHVLDEIRLNRYTTFDSGLSSSDRGVYTIEPNQPKKCLIDINPRAEALSGDLSVLPNGTKIYYDNVDSELWYRDPLTNQVFLIADQIKSFNLTPSSEHLIQVYLEAGDDSGAFSHKLLTWIRLY